MKHPSLRRTSKKTATLLLVALLIVVAAAVYYAYIKKDDDKTAVQATQQSAAANQPDDKAVSYSPQKLENVGIEFNMPETIGILFTPSDSLASGEVVAFSTQNLAKAEAGMYCEALAKHTGNPSHLGVLHRQSGTYPGQDKAEGELVKQFDGFYVQLITPEASCFKSQDNYKTAADHSKLLMSSLKEAKAL